MMKLKTIFAIAILAAGAISLPSMAITATVSVGPWQHTNAFGCTWQVTYNNGYSSNGVTTEIAIYRPIGTCQYTTMHYNYNSSLSTSSAKLTAN